MGEIKVINEEFNRVSIQFSEAANSTSKIQQTIQTATTTLLENWKGKGKEAFDNEYQIIYKNMYTYSEVLMDISKELADIGKQFEELDSNLGSELLKSVSNLSNPSNPSILSNPSNLGNPSILNKYSN